MGKWRAFFISFLCLAPILSSATTSKTVTTVDTLMLFEKPLSAAQLFRAAAVLSPSAYSKEFVKLGKAAKGVAGPMMNREGDIIRVELGGNQVELAFNRKTPGRILVNGQKYFFNQTLPLGWHAQALGRLVEQSKSRHTRRSFDFGIAEAFADGDQTRTQHGNIIAAMALIGGGPQAGGITLETLEALQRQIDDLAAEVNRLRERGARGYGSAAPLNSREYCENLYEISARTIVNDLRDDVAAFSCSKGRYDNISIRFQSGRSFTAEAGRNFSSETSMINRYTFKSPGFEVNLNQRAAAEPTFVVNPCSMFYVHPATRRDTAEAGKPSYNEPNNLHNVLCRKAFQMDRVYDLREGLPFSMSDFASRETLVAKIDALFEKLPNSFDSITERDQFRALFAERIQPKKEELIDLLWSASQIDPVALCGDCNRQNPPAGLRAAIDRLKGISANRPEGGSPTDERDGKTTLTPAR